MMIMPHILSSKDQWFLNLKRKDPLTAGQFQAGDSVVVCTKCRTVHLTATWYFGAAGCKAAGCGCTSHAYHFGRETVEYPTLSLGKKTSASVGRSAPQGRSSGSNWGGALLALILVVLCIGFCLSQCSREQVSNGGLSTPPDTAPEYVYSPPETTVPVTGASPVIEALHIAPLDQKDLSVDVMGSRQLCADAAVIDQTSYQLSEQGQQLRHVFHIPRDGRYLVGVEGLSDEMVLEARILNGAGTEVESDSYFVKGDSFTMKGLEQGQTYTLELTQKEGLGALTVVVGNQKSHINATDYTHIFDSVEYKDQRNVYEFTVPRDGRYRIELQDLADGVATELYAFDSNGDVFASDVYAVNGSGLTLKNLKAGEHYQFQVRQSKGTSAYILFIGYQKEYLDVTGYTKLHDSIQYTDQRNVYLYTVPVSGRYRIELQGLSDGCVAELYAFDSEGQSIDYDTNAVNGDGLTLKGLEAGVQYRFQVRQSKGTPEYTLAIGCQKPTVCVDVNMDVHDSLEFTHQRNVYELLAVSADPITVTLSQMDSDCVAELYIFDDESNLVYTDACFISGASYTFTPEIGEVYRLQIRQYKGFCPYILTIR